MAEFSLTLEAVQDLDIKSARLTGITNDPIYKELVGIYKLDLAQCFLWLDVTHLFDQLMDAYDYEDLKISEEEFAAAVQKILQEKQKKFPFLWELLNHHNLLQTPSRLTVVLKEMSEDIQMVYKDIQEDLKEILASQDEISRLVDGQLS